MVKFPAFEGNDPQGQIARTMNVLEVKNIKGSTKVC